MTLNEIALWSEILTGVATFLGLFFVGYEIRKSRQNEKREIIFETQKMWTDMDETLQREREMDWEDYEDFKSKYMHGDQKAFRDVLNILNFMEMISELLQLGILDKEITLGMWGDMAIFYYVRYKDILKGYREEIYPRWYEKIDWLTEESLVVKPEAEKVAEVFWEKQKESVRNSAGD